jgi:hypothetical protein
MLLGLFDPDDGDNILLRNVGSLPTDYTALYPIRRKTRFLYDSLVGVKVKRTNEKRTRYLTFHRAS